MQRKFFLVLFILSTSYLACNDSIIVVRPAFKVKEKELESFSKRVHTRYKKGSLREEAPVYSDCVTIIGYLFNKTMNRDLELVWIGNLPRSLVSKGWKILKISPLEIKGGDLLFLRDKRRKNLITHVVIAISSTQFFHSSKLKQGESIETLDELLTIYTQPDSIKTLLNYIDLRTNSEKKDKSVQNLSPTVK